VTSQPKTSFKDLLGTMYKRYVLDYIIDIAHAISIDFSSRIHLYRNIDQATATNLTNLQSNYGFTGNFPNKETRTILYMPIFGKLGSDGWGNANSGSDWQTWRLKVLAASVALAENFSSTPQIGDSSLIEGVRSPSVNFINHMLDFEGASLTQTDARIKEIFKISESILKDKGVAAVFGVNGAIDPKWPLLSRDSNAVTMVHQVTTQLPNNLWGEINREKVRHLEEIANRGEKAIIGILDPKFETDDAALLKTNAELNAWARELGLVGGVIPQ
jgi:hypothetical protein